MTNKLIFGIAFSLFLSISAIGQENFTHPDSLLLKELEIYEVTIEASRNESKLKDLPVSLSIINARTIKNNDISTLHHVAGITPNLFMPNYGSKLTSPVYIRGIGSRINSPSVGLYVDGIPYFEKSTFAFEFFDLERIEVLRGPQGTLFGRNSMGGLINITTKNPMQHQGGAMNLSYGNYGQYRANIEHYNKVNEKFAYSFSWNAQHTNGMYMNEFNNRPVDKLNSYGFRNKLIYQWSDKVTLENIAMVENSKQGGYPYALWNDSLEAANPVNYNNPSGYDRLLFSDALKYRYQTKDYELSNTLSFQYLDDVQRIDQDFTPADLYYVEQTQEQKMVANELIARSRGERKFSWLVGIFAFHQSFDNAVEVDVIPQNMWYLKQYDNTVNGFAGFAQASYHLTPSLSITGGLRYDYESSGMAYQYDLQMGENMMPPIDTVYPGLTDRIILPKLALNYTINNANIFASYTTGYKPGGFNSTFEKPEHLTFKNERSNNYELGIKSPFYQNLLYAEFALFYTALENQQIYLTAPSGRGSYLGNSGLSENKGIELTLRNSPINGFEGMIAYGYTHSQILEYVQDEETNFNNNYTPYIPRHTLAVQLTKTFRIKGFETFEYIKLNAMYNQVGQTYWNLSNTYKQETYGLLNGKISFIRDDFQFDFWGRNILNANYQAFLFEALGNTYVQVGQPMQYGVSLSIKF